jgi:hypothetical protein
MSLLDFATWANFGGLIRKSCNPLILFKYPTDLLLGAPPLVDWLKTSYQLKNISLAKKHSHLAGT